MVESVGSNLILREKDVVQFLCHNKGQCARLQDDPLCCHIVLFHHTEVWKAITFFAVA